MSSIKFFVAIFIIFTIAGSMMVIGEACEESFNVFPCVVESCNRYCKIRRGLHAEGRCTAKTTCTCIYPC
ncbi:hypothetical protein HanXRQr2_Chr10g0449781 [Helianthus annuus]|uniref:Uncharacterized protein n=1 Tax=Helianthus annuus TaxID=4232 RepID=A0A251TL27_HELAN|nr:hypothetical protein HanXRQr2_Chr10g0449781 [Helianthus annuus]KAJ0884474.1 hypothetical protein HanPSC8_Chr10g0434111 [Helianthus annuus]